MREKMHISLPLLLSRNLCHALQVNNVLRVAHQGTEGSCVCVFSVSGGEAPALNCPGNFPGKWLDVLTLVEV